MTIGQKYPEHGRHGPGNSSNPRKLLVKVRENCRSMIDLLVSLIFFAAVLVFLLVYQAFFVLPTIMLKWGGSPRSMHLFGLAADIQTVNKDRNLILELAKSLKFTGFGYYRTFLHVDLGRKREWGKWYA